MNVRLRPRGAAQTTYQWFGVTRVESDGEMILLEVPDPTRHPPLVVVAAMALQDVAEIVLDEDGGNL